MKDRFQPVAHTELDGKGMALTCLDGHTGNSACELCTSCMITQMRLVRLVTCVALPGSETAAIFATHLAS